MKMNRIIDAHCHTNFKYGVKETINALENILKINNLYRGIIQSIPNDSVGIDDPMQNATNLFLKEYFGDKFYVYAGIEHRNFDCEEQTSKYFLRQAKEYKKLGFDGIKLLEGKPNQRKRLKTLLSHSVYDEFFAYLQENELPITLHNADPCEFWDINKLSQDAIDAGWYNDESGLTKAQMEEDVFKVMEKFPNLRLTIAHFGFFTDNYENAEKFLGNYKYTAFDVAPAPEEYGRISNNSKLWRKFILKYQDKIKYATDADTRVKISDNAFTEAVTLVPNFVKKFFETEEDLHLWGVDCKGINMPDSFLEKFYYKNIINELGNPKPIDKQGLKEMLFNLKKVLSNKAQIDDVDFMLEYLDK